MIPAYIIRLDEMPYTINRKIDRKALPYPKISSYKQNEVTSASNGLDENETILLNIWKNILKKDDISPSDNFFDIGGDSISAINMQIEALKYGLEFDYSDIFNFPTISMLAHKIPKQEDDFIQTYDYTRVNEVLSRNTEENFKTISEIDPGNVLLIGGTGYLGSHIAYQFLKENTGDLYCLIRAKGSGSVRFRLLNSLRFYFGDEFVESVSDRIKVFAR